MLLCCTSWLGPCQTITKDSSQTQSLWVPSWWWPSDTLSLRPRAALGSSLRAFSPIHPRARSAALVPQAPIASSDVRRVVSSLFGILRPGVGRGALTETPYLGLPT